MKYALYNITPVYLCYEAVMLFIELSKQIQIQYAYTCSVALMESVFTLRIIVFIF